MKVNIEKQGESKPPTSTQLVPKKVLVRGNNGSYYAIRYVRSGSEEGKGKSNLGDMDLMELLEFLEENTLDQTQLHGLINHEDQYIKKYVAERIDQKGLHELINSDDNNVKHIIVKRIDQAGLHEMMNEKDWLLRRKVAERIDRDGLREMMNDESEFVRSQVVERMNQKGLHDMMGDKSKIVREHVAERIDQAGLHEMMNDEEESVRLEIAKRIDLIGLNKMKDDEDVCVNVKVSHRIEVIDRTQSMIDAYKKDKKIVPTTWMTGELTRVIDEEDDSVNIIECTNEFYMDIAGGKFSDFHLKSKDAWEDSSSAELALLLKDSIKRQFGGEIRHHDDVDDYDKKANELYKIHNMKNVDEYVKIQKDLTRKYLDQMFPDTDIITIYRGTTIMEIENLDDNRSVIAKSNPLSSWTLKESVADSFRRFEDGGVILTTEVHKDEIWSTFMCHAYQGYEREILLIGNKDRKVNVI